MKLNKDNYTKTIDPQYITYMYNCNDTNFYLRVKRGTNNTEISLFSGSIDDPQNEVKVDNALNAWKTFEEMLEVCAPEQASSGGFAQDRQNPNFLPLLAIKQLSSGEHLVTIFLVEDSGAQKVMEQFTITQNAMPSTIPQDKVFVVDWTGQDIMMLLKCEILMLPYPSVQFEDDKNAKVFLFIPKSIGDQGGETGGGESTSGTSGTSGSSGTEGTSGSAGSDGTSGSAGSDGTSGSAGSNGTSGSAGSDGSAGTDGSAGSDGTSGSAGSDGSAGSNGTSGSAGTDGSAGSNGTSGSAGTDGSAGSDGTSGSAGTDGSYGSYGTSGRVQPQEPKQQLSQQELINKLAQSIDMPPQNVERSFRNVDVGELFLQLQDFEKIKKDLNLPPQTSARSLSEQIINLQ